MSPNFNAVKTRSEIKTRNFSTLTFSAFTCAQISCKSSKSAQVTGTSPPECQPEPTQLPLPHSGGAAGPTTAFRAESRGGAGEERGEEPDQGCTAEANSLYSPAALSLRPLVAACSSSGVQQKQQSVSLHRRPCYQNQIIYEEMMCLQSLQDNESNRLNQ